MRCRWAAAVWLLASGGVAAAQAPPAPPDPGAQPPAPARSVRAVDPAEPDFTIAALPTSLRVPQYKGAFRVTHRFGRPLGRGDFGDLLGDLFGLDSGARIGLEFRFGLAPGTQIGIHRTNDRTIEFFGQHSVIRQAPDASPVSLDAIVTVEGLENFRQNYTTAIGAIVSHKIGGHAALYLEPMWVANVNLLPDPVPEEHTVLLGLGARVRVRPTVYVIAEVSPRVAGYDPGANQVSVGIEKRAGGHSFQLNVSNGFGTTIGQVARGGFNNGDWFLGFNISRKFF
jgi:hypothetical protein